MFSFFSGMERKRAVQVANLAAAVIAIYNFATDPEASGGESLVAVSLPALSFLALREDSLIFSRLFSAVGNGIMGKGLLETLNCVSCADSSTALDIIQATLNFATMLVVIQPDEAMPSVDRHPGA
jgi:hypothetical protein